MSSDAGYPFKVWHLDARSECVTVCQFTVTILKRKLFPYWILLKSSLLFCSDSSAALRTGSF